MALIYRDRVRQKAAATGTGNVQLATAVSSYITFSQASLGANSFPYAIINSAQFELGIGTFDGTYLYRNLILSTSNADQNLVNFNGSACDVIITNPAELSVLVSVQPTSNTLKYVKWVNSQFSLVDPVENPQAGMQSSVLFYNYANGSYNADPKFQFYPGALPEVFVDGVLQARAKSFVIPHPTKRKYELHHGCLEGPEYGIYLRGSLQFYHKAIILFPSYFQALANNYTVHITPHNNEKIKIVKESDCVELRGKFFGKTCCDYLIIAARTDLLLEVEKNVR